MCESYDKKLQVARMLPLHLEGSLPFPPENTSMRGMLCNCKFASTCLGLARTRRTRLRITSKVLNISRTLIYHSHMKFLGAHAGGGGSTATGCMFTQTMASCKVPMQAWYCGAASSLSSEIHAGLEFARAPPPFLHAPNSADIIARRLSWYPVRYMAQQVPSMR